MKAEDLINSYPRLYHMAAAGSWDNIRKHGLLSTSALLDLFEIRGEMRISLEDRHRPQSVQISHPVYGTAEIRDQKPMSDSGLKRALPPGTATRTWYRLLNERVFFWLTEERLNRLLGARAYRDQVHSVLTIDTKSLVDAHSSAITLCPINSGCTVPFPHPRDHRVFHSIGNFPFAQRRASRSLGDVVVELAVVGGVPDIERYVIEVRETVGGQAGKMLFRK